MKHLFVIIVVVSAALAAREVGADTGQLREVAVGNGIRAIVYTSPTPLRAGLVEVTVVATNEQGGTPLAEFELDVQVRRPEWAADSPSMLIGGGPDPSDGFARKAILDLPAEGPWELLVEVRADERALRVPVLVSAGAPWPVWWQILPVALSGAPFLLLVLLRDHLARQRGD